MGWRALVKTTTHTVDTVSKTTDSCRFRVN